MRRPSVRLAVALCLFVLSGFGLARRAAHAADRPVPTHLTVHESVATGIDVLRAEGFARLRGQRVALLTNVAARTRDGLPTIEAFRAAANVSLVALFTPEHGLTAMVDARVPSGRDERTGLIVHSLYAETRRPTAAMLAGIDVIAIDLPDVGARFYTYATTMAYVLEEAATHAVPVMVLDRPNPINGRDVEGPSLDAGISGFTAYFPMPVRHGLTLGELALLFNAERQIGADLTVLTAQGWRREAWFDETGLPWSNPSPNIRSLDEAALYPGIGAIESSNISVGRGTRTPFEVIGAPWIDGRRLARVLNQRRIGGVSFSAATFTPNSSTYANRQCSGVRLVLTNRDELKPVQLGVEIAAALWTMYPGHYQFGTSGQAFGAQATIERIKRGDDPRAIARSWSADEALWRETRRKYLLYQ